MHGEVLGVIILANPSFYVLDFVTQYDIVCQMYR